MTEQSGRRDAIVEYLAKQTMPVNGSELARIFGVSRQVIVQDIALLRAQRRDILSTNKGYLIYQTDPHPMGCSEVITVNHPEDRTLDEMRAIVELGGSMLDVSVDHDLYGLIRLDLVINNMRDAEEFCNRLSGSSSKPLNELTGGLHYHTIHAPSQKAMDLIKQELFNLKILIL
ncbi:MAG: transcription repressor NadR [Lachnospiraceae bacterium]|nr:transcription repressor NadR [Lachnospiraceae bacterium]